MGTKSSPGFSLVEVLTVLALLTIGIGLAALNLFNFSSGYQLREASREVAADLQFARLLAVTENRDIQVVFHSDFYEIIRVNDHYVTKSRILRADYPRISLCGLPVTFNSRGNANPQTISLSHSLGAKNVTVNFTGGGKAD